MTNHCQLNALSGRYARQAGEQHHAQQTYGMGAGWPAGNRALRDETGDIATIRHRVCPETNIDRNLILLLGQMQVLSRHRASVAQGPEKGTDIVNQLSGLLERSKVSPRRHLCPVLDVI